MGAMSTSNAPGSSPRLHLRTVDQTTLTKVVRALSPTQEWRMAAMEYARRTNFGEVEPGDLDETSEMAQVLKHLLMAVNKHISFSGGTSLKDLAAIGCPGALLKVLQVQVKKAGVRARESGRVSTTSAPISKPVTRTSNRVKPKTEPTPVTETPSTMSLCTVRRVKQLEVSDTHVRIRVYGIAGGEEERIEGIVAIGRPLSEQLQLLAQQAGRTFVPHGRLEELISGLMRDAKSAATG